MGIAKDIPPLQGKSPEGTMELRTLCMPKDTNPAGDIFGGYLLSQMDVAGALSADRVAKGRVVTVALDAMSFHEPVYVGDTLCCYGKVIKTGKTSITVQVEAWATTRYTNDTRKVTEGTFTYVAIDEHRKPRTLG